ncbi:MAG: restriction endonuclease [Candidatus Schekmanbacteria bacterium]|nr:MAG: restriction endonuclease [Candidatus Schekmanbacteria bacterium]
MKRIFEIGKEYVDKGNPNFEEDQFMRWINIPGVSGMMNSPGIRWLRYKDKKELPAALILITKTASSSYHNPWEDVIDRNNGVIYYWGDAKADQKRKCEDFMGNKILKKVHDKILEGNLKEIPPILFFSKPERGKIIFEGLCVMENLERTWFEDKGKPVRNYRAVLQILDIDPVDLDWIHKKVKGEKYTPPKIWKDYTSGKKPAYLKVWRKNIKSKEEQLPAKNSSEYKILEEIHRLKPKEFERFTVYLIESIKGIKHSIMNTRFVKDKGFDFFGHFTLPYPLNYTIFFKGEAKKFGPNNAVGPKDLSRLAAKLNRGEYGLFITTSYFSMQAQEELFEDSYPIKLISGMDVINFLRELRLIAHGRLNKSMLDKIREELS